MQLKPMACILCFRAQSPMEWCALRNGITCCYRVTITSDRIIILLVMKYDYNVKTSCHALAWEKPQTSVRSIKWIWGERERERKWKNKIHILMTKHFTTKSLFLWIYAIKWPFHCLSSKKEYAVSGDCWVFCWEWCKMMTIWIMGVLKWA